MLRALIHSVVFLGGAAVGIAGTATYIVGHQTQAIIHENPYVVQDDDSEPDFNEIIEQMLGIEV